MGDIDKLLDDFKDDGVEDSSGVFTIDFQKAREKLAKFQLADPHEFILKLVQAGNLASSSMDISAGMALSVEYARWDRDLSLRKLADRLASASLNVGDDALSYLCIGLSAMMGLAPAPIRLRQRLQGETAVNSLMIGKSLEWEVGEESSPAKSDSLDITMTVPERLSVPRLQELLEERCAFAPVSIAWQGRQLKGRLPEPTGAHRPPFFRENKVLVQHRLYVDQKDKWNTPQLSVNGKLQPSVRMAHLALTVDLDPKATIWFSKAGVLAERKRLDLGVPGLIGVVAADDVATDLTGSQFQDGEALVEVKKWLRQAGQVLLGDAIEATQSIISEAQPASPQAPVNLRYGCVGGSVALLGWLLGVAVISHLPGTSGWIMPNTMFWVFFPALWVAVSVKRHGCEMDDKSDRAAKDLLLDTLKRAKRG